jgi:hypothetical protein
MFFIAENNTKICKENPQSFTELKIRGKYFMKSTRHSSPLFDKK